MLNRRLLIRMVFSAPAALPLMEGLSQSTAAGAPVPVVLPRDDGVHDSAVEWWYFTGHLFTAYGDRYGFEFVIFRARNGALEGYAAHFAVTDNPRGVFRYDQRVDGARGVAGDRAALDLDLGGWTMRGEDGEFALQADMPGYRTKLLTQPAKPAALHEGDGYIEYGNGTASYYYSWTRLDVTGAIDLGEGPLPVTGEAWMDHQWGDFATFQEGGWDWFSVQLEDGTDVMLYLIRDPRGEPVVVDGTVVAADGSLTVLENGDFVVTNRGEWTSPHTGTTYPSGWTIGIPAQELTLDLVPSLPDQELDTRATTGVIYWEGEVIVTATVRGQPVNGLGYVELTGYAPYVPLAMGTPAATPQVGA